MGPQPVLGPLGELDWLREVVAAVVVTLAVTELDDVTETDELQLTLPVDEADIVADVEFEVQNP